MNVIVYCIKCAVKSIKRKKVFSLFIVCSFALGIFSTAIILCASNSYFSRFRDSQMKDYGRVIEVSIPNSFDKFLFTEDVEDMLKDNSQIDCISTIIRKEQIVRYDDRFLYTKVMCVDDKINYFYNSLVNEGNWFNYYGQQDTELTCVVGSSFAKKNFKNNELLHSTLNINGNEFKIIGISSHTLFQDAVVIPTAYAKSAGITKAAPQHFLRIKAGYPLDESLSLIKSVFSDRYDYAKINLMSDTYSNEIATKHKVIAIIFLITGLVLLYSLFNIICIIFNKIDLSRKNIAICIAVGAKVKYVYFQSLAEITLLSVLSSILVFTLMPLAKYILVGLPIDLKIDARVLVELIAVSLAISTVLSLFLIRRILRINVADILKGNGAI